MENILSSHSVRLEYLVEDLSNEFAGKCPESEEKENDEDEDQHADDDWPVEMTPDDGAKSFLGRCQPEKGRGQATSRREREGVGMTGGDFTYFRSSNG